MGLFRYRRRTLLRELGMLALAALWWVPFYVLAVNSVRPSGDLTPTGLKPPQHPDLSVYRQAWDGNGSGTLGDGLRSSLVVCVGSVALLVVLGSLAAYVVARRGGRLGATAYLVMVLGIVLPYQLGLVPLFRVFKHLGLVGNYTGLILLYTGILMPLTIFLYTGFVRALPRDYEEAAQVDGASPLRSFVKVVFPLLRPVTATVAILTGLVIWNDFFTQLVFLTGTSRETLPVAVYSFVGAFGTQWNLIFAAVAIALAPVLIFFLFAQKRLTHGFSGGIKG
jgi:raffinose/stachyose/melibiose transport system permease protein